MWGHKKRAPEITPGPVLLYMVHLCEPPFLGGKGISPGQKSSKILLHQRLFQRFQRFQAFLNGRF